MYDSNQRSERHIYEILTDSCRICSAFLKKIEKTLDSVYNICYNSIQYIMFNVKSIGDQIYELIKSQILTGEIASGAILSIDGLAKTIKNASRTPVRDAVNRLKGEGLVVSSETGKLQVIRLAREQIVQIYELRADLEILGLKWGYRNIDKQDLQEQLDFLEELEKEVYEGRIDRWEKTDIKLHELIIASSGNQWLERVYSQLRNIVTITMQMFKTLERIVQTYEDHKEILRTLISGDLKSAQEILTEHISGQLRFILDQYDRIEQNDPAGGKMSRAAEKEG